jgi:hypothetical protein
MGAQAAGWRSARRNLADLAFLGHRARAIGLEKHHCRAYEAPVDAEQ